ncbi:MAG: DegT/DnrJ/EryC1/StrS family aminotransferase [Candidatus Omnitrophica bacterium]|nr:DegT/DnrJ/EryC1/StrS family aminotransferase [Candidatus Omnitrophota bacterium]
MAIVKIPIAGCKIPAKYIFFSLKNIFQDEKAVGLLKGKFDPILNKRHLFFFNSGLACFYLILKALKQSSGKKEVVLSAYTAGSLVVAIKKAGLTPVLCDITLDDFNMDMNSLGGVICGKTLCVLGVHMFGIVQKGLVETRERFPDVFTIEDCAQAMGSKLKGKDAGNFGDISFFSFNRGKNLSTYGGGLISARDEKIAGLIQKAALDSGAPPLTLSEKIEILFKLLALNLAINPLVYGLLYPLISRFKDTMPPEDIIIKQYSGVQAGIALALLGGVKEISKNRYALGMKLIAGLKGTEGVILPKIDEATQPAFNRLPVVFEDLARRDRVEAALCKQGIETSRLYHQPLHQMFALGYKKDDFPNACYFAEHVLTLPTHPLLTECSLERIITTIKNS